MSMIDHPHAIPQTAKRSSFDRRSTGERPYANGHSSASCHRAYVVVFVFGIFAALFAATLALRTAISLPLFGY
jgi:hypothetical protein